MCALQGLPSPYSRIFSLRHILALLPQRQHTSLLKGLFQTNMNMREELKKQKDGEVIV